MITPEYFYNKLKIINPGACIHNYTLSKCEEFVPVINRINELKKKKNAVILAHSYVNPEIVYGVADFVGDSYGLSKDAKKTDADIIIFAAVKFMAETAKILNPGKEVLVPSQYNGCSLADSITRDDVITLRKQYPEYSFICYINTNADVKAECDICVTSSNVYNVIENCPSDKIYFLPDRLMGLNIIEEMKRRGICKDIKLWTGKCYVHEEYKHEMIYQLKFQFDNLKVLAHPECSPEVLHQSDFTGSTSDLLKYMETASDGNAYLMLTECGITSRLQVEMPEKKIVGSCTLCKYMRSNTLDDILRVLENPEDNDRIILNEDISLKALTCVEAMFKYAEK
ncbi:MAG: quinolinate synthase NadA [Spirochaetes bacterium]|nr:quinolinate synthase NadA [Spirochaetota bacterium]